MPDATPGQTVGPFFHDALPYDGGRELVRPRRRGRYGCTAPCATATATRSPTRWSSCGRPTPPAGCRGSRGRCAATAGSPAGAGPRPTRPGATTSRRSSPAGVDGGAAFFALTVFARGLTDRLFTRAYLPGERGRLPRRRSTEEERRTLQVVRADDGSLEFDIRLQGEGETVFLRFPGHAR